MDGGSAAFPAPGGDAARVSSPRSYYGLGVNQDAFVFRVLWTAPSLPLRSPISSFPECPTNPCLPLLPTSRADCAYLRGGPGAATLRSPLSTPLSYTSHTSHTSGPSRARTRRGTLRERGHAAAWAVRSEP